MLLAVQLVFGAYIVGMDFYGARAGLEQYGGGAPKSPLYGIWNVEQMTIDGHDASPLVTDYGRWRRVIFQTPTGMTFQRMDDTFAGYGAKIDIDREDDRADQAGRQELEGGVRLRAAGARNVSSSTARWTATRCACSSRCSIATGSCW